MLRMFQEMQLKKDELAVVWLGQAGYLFRSGSDRYVVIDPYLSDYCEEMLGVAFKRIMPKVLDPADLNRLQLDAYIMTHHHEDHFDLPTIRAMTVTTHPYYAPPTCISLLEQLGIDRNRCFPLVQGTHLETDGFSVTATFADHGELAPDAVGILFKFGDKVVFHMGDTCLREEELKKISERTEIDLLIVPINGKYGNMNETGAAVAVRILQPKKVIPCHFWMLPANSGGDPAAFIELVNQGSSGSQATLLTQGEAMIL